MRQHLRTLPALAISAIFLALAIVFLTWLYFKRVPLPTQWQSLVANLISAFVGSLATVLLVNLVIEHERKQSRRPAERTALVATLEIVKDLVCLVALMRKAAMDPQERFPANVDGILSTKTFEVIQHLDLDKGGPIGRGGPGNTIISITWREHIPSTIVGIANAVQEVLRTHGSFSDPEVIADLYNLSQTTLFKVTPLLANMGRLDHIVERALIVDVIATNDIPTVLRLIRRLEQLSRRHGIHVVWFDNQLLSSQIAPDKGSARRP